MGAGGGVCWMKVRDPSRYDRVLELLKPFYILTDQNQNADWQQTTVDAFWELSPIADMKVSSWLEELRSLLDWKHSGSEETWT